MNTSVDIRHLIARQIVEFEARRHPKTKLIQIYNLPSGDGGGTYEVAGINDRYHPHESAHLARLIRSGRHKEAEDLAAMYIASYTDAATLWHKNLGIQAFLRDCIFNRGYTGAAKILQRAVGLTSKRDLDGRIGPRTRAEIAKYSAADLLARLRKGREEYERSVGRDEASKFWVGLQGRWAKAVDLANRYIDQEDS